MRRKLLLTAVVLAASLAAAPAPATTTHSSVRGNELWYRTPDGVQLVGHRFGGRTPGQRPTIVLAHQSSGDLCEWTPYARELARKGFFVFAFDFRGHGFSKGTVRFGRLPGDVAATVKIVRRLGARRVVLVGSSMGGIASIVAAPNLRPPVNGVVSLSAPAAWNGLSGTAAAARLRAPALYIAAARDQTSGFDFARDARALYAATPGDDKELEVVDSDLHGIALLQATPALKTLIEGFARGENAG
jgi:pimeloyl-ACP methyl ester carboxylesterase